ncbi:hypothetical protein Micbo1qcDRAFT_206977 [Microdochium bolleyi]|uniref:Uncharacterized protein n=1 Tax=Microdochium bolleyi TaxID=196109 RepID=A0A136IUW7_9PEZI|nr:hypothetical protein Micbo1qcDRAFT_206977 [Microdochium bolleyi]
MYGLGIRLGFYLNWFAGILANLIAVQEIETIRYAFTCFIGATFLALVVQTAQKNTRGTAIDDNTGLTALDTHVVLLLCFGYYYSIVPTYLWRLVTGFDPRLDPTRWPRLKPSVTYIYAHAALVAGVAGFQLWFWAVEAPRTEVCGWQGFLFVMAPMTGNAFRYVSIAFQAVILLICLVSLGVQMFSTDNSQPIHISERHKSTLRIVHAIMLFVIASIIVVATELTIAWNGVTGVNQLNSAGQLIPFVVGVGVLGRVIYLAIRRPPPAPASGSGSSGGVGNGNGKEHTRPHHIDMECGSPPDRDTTATSHYNGNIRRESIASSFDISSISVPSMNVSSTNVSSSNQDDDANVASWAPSGPGHHRLGYLPSSAHALPMEMGGPVRPHVLPMCTSPPVVVPSVKSEPSVKPAKPVEPAALAEPNAPSSSRTPGPRVRRARLFEGTSCP